MVKELESKQGRTENTLEKQNDEISSLKRERDQLRNKVLYLIDLHVCLFRLYPFYLFVYLFTDFMYAVQREFRGYRERCVDL